MDGWMSRAYPRGEARPIRPCPMGPLDPPGTVKTGRRAGYDAELAKKPAGSPVRNVRVRSEPGGALLDGRTDGPVLLHGQDLPVAVVHDEHRARVELRVGDPERVVHVGQHRAVRADGGGLWPLEQPVHVPGDGPWRGVLLREVAGRPRGRAGDVGVRAQRGPAAPAARAEQPADAVRTEDRAPAARPAACPPRSAAAPGRRPSISCGTGLAVPQHHERVALLAVRAGLLRASSRSRVVGEPPVAPCRATPTRAGRSRRSGGTPRRRRRRRRDRPSSCTRLVAVLPVAHGVALRAAAAARAGRRSPVSSATSRTAAAVTCSPGSTLPLGNDQSSYSGRCTSSTSGPRRETTAPARHDLGFLGHAASLTSTSNERVNDAWTPEVRCDVDLPGRGSSATSGR